ncbi:hypothetical protein ASC90_25245 [Rhizobium sp. Root1220]|nr:hypothetical protein ASC90_25245 [Rhizobium sp. Root1220]
MPTEKLVPAVWLMRAFMTGWTRLWRLWSEHRRPVAPPVQPAAACRDSVQKRNADVGISKAFGADWKATNIAACSNVVLNERVDVFTQGNGRQIIQPVMRAITIESGMASLWRDYFSLPISTGNSPRPSADPGAKKTRCS